MENKQQEKPEIAILTQYVKDFSFEAPNSPEIFFNKENISANINLNIDIKVKTLKEDLYNVDLIFKINNTYGEENKNIFLIELVYGGIVTLNMPEEKREKTLLTTVPSYLFPHVRALITRVTSESGFPPFTLAPIDWEVMYTNNKNNVNSVNTKVH